VKSKTVVSDKELQPANLRTHASLVDQSQRGGHDTRPKTWTWNEDWYVVV